MFLLSEDDIVSGEKEYKKKDREMEELSKQIREYDLTKEQKQAVDRLLSVENTCCARYGELASKK